MTSESAIPDSEISMPITAQCDDCGKSYRVGDDKAGKKFKCKDCGGVISVPAAEEDDWGEPAPSPRRAAPKPGGKPVKKAARSQGKSGGGLSPAVLIGGIVGVLLLVGGVLGYMFLGGKGDANVAANNTPNAAPGPAAAGGAAPAAAIDPLAYVPPDAIGFLLVRPKRLYESPIIKAVPKELVDESMAKVQQQNPLGIDPWKIEIVSASLVMPAKTAAPTAPGPAGAAPPAGPGPPPGGGPESGLPMMVVVVRYAEPLKVSELIEKSKDLQDQVSEQTAGSRKYWRIVKMRRDFSSFGPPTTPGGTLPEPKFVEAARLAVVSIDDRTIVFGNEQPTLKTLEGKQTGAVTARLQNMSLDQDLVLAGIPSASPDLTSMAGMASQGSLPPGAARSVSEGIGQVKSFVVAADFTGQNLLSVMVEGMTPDATTKFHTQATEGQTHLKQTFEQMTAQYRTPDAPPMEKDLVAFGDKVIGGLTVTKSGNDVQATLKNPGGWDQLMAGLKPAIEQARNAAKATQSLSTMKQISLGFYNFHDSHGHFPPIVKPGTTPAPNRLSWRVYILPYIEHAALYNEFHLDEPWDSPHNKTLISRMPAIYASPQVADKTKTRFVGFAGDQSALGSPALKLRDLTDGTSNTILVVEAAPEKAVVWTQPDELPFDPSNPIAALGNIGERFPVVFADGSARLLPKTIAPMTLKALITRNGGEAVTDF